MPNWEPPFQPKPTKRPVAWARTLSTLDCQSHTCVACHAPDAVSASVWKAPAQHAAKETLERPPRMRVGVWRSSALPVPNRPLAPAPHVKRWPAHARHSVSVSVCACECRIVAGARVVSTCGSNCNRMGPASIDHGDGHGGQMAKNECWSPPVNNIALTQTTLGIISVHMKETCVRGRVRKWVCRSCLLPWCSTHLQP